MEPMAAHNADVAALFYRMADLFEIESANPFCVRAYRRAAAITEDLAEPAAELLAKGADLAELPGIGDDPAGKIREIRDTGRLKALDEVEAQTPSVLAARSIRIPACPRRTRLAGCCGPRHFPF